MKGNKKDSKITITECFANILCYYVIMYIE